MKITDAMKALWMVKATVLLSVLLVGSYFLLSEGSMFISRERLLGLSFSFARPFNLVLYMFAHISTHHLAVNLAYIVLFALIVELALTATDVLLIFLLSGIGTAIVFSGLNPGINLVGASAGGAALIASSTLLNLKRAIIALIAIGLVFLVLPNAINFLQEQEEAGLNKRAVELQQSYDQAVQAGQTDKVGKIAAEKQLVETKMQQFRESKKSAIETKSDFLIHLYAAIFGALYILIFRRKKLVAPSRQLHAIFKRAT